MAFNVRSEGRNYEVVVAETVKSGDVVKVGSLAGVAETDARLGEDDGQWYATVAFEGVAGIVLPSAPVNAGETVSVSSTGKVEFPAKPGSIILGYVLNPVATANGQYEIKIANGTMPAAAV